MVMYMNTHYGSLIGKTLGEVEDVEVDTNDTSWGPYIRLSVQINFHKAVTSGKSLEVRGEKL